MILVFSSRNFLTDHTKAVLVFDILPCMCPAALWSPVGKGAKVDVAGPAGPAFAGPIFFGRECFPPYPFYLEAVYTCILVRAFACFGSKFFILFTKCCASLACH